MKVRLPTIPAQAKPVQAPPREDLVLTPEAAPKSLDTCLGHPEVAKNSACETICVEYPACKAAADAVTVLPETTSLFVHSINNPFGDAQGDPQKGMEDQFDVADVLLMDTPDTFAEFRTAMLKRYEPLPDDELTRLLLEQEKHGVLRVMR
jgi:hypothetical protein